MKNWIPFGEGEYLAEKAFLVAPTHAAVALEDAIIEVYSDPRGQRQLKGRSRIRNILMVELLEDNDDLDIVLDLGREFKYRLKTPGLQGGKVFSSDVKSMLQFIPTSPWEQIPEAEFEEMLLQLKFIGD